MGVLPCSIARPPILEGAPIKNALALLYISFYFSIVGLYFFIAGLESKATQNDKYKIHLMNPKNGL